VQDEPFDWLVTNTVDGVGPPAGMRRHVTYCHDCGRPVYWTVRTDADSAAVRARNGDKAVVCGGCGAARLSAWRARQRGEL
jgi:hypothetical protein